MVMENGYDYFYTFESSGLKFNYFRLLFIPTHLYLNPLPTSLCCVCKTSIHLTDKRSNLCLTHA